MYFERCHAADRDPARSDDERRACWQAWRDHYEVGQPDDRIDYVRERLVMLDPTNGDAIALASPEVESGVAVEEVATLDASAPTDSAVAIADPPPAEGPELSDSVADRPPRARRRPTAPRNRTSACGASCEPAFVDCASECRVADRGCTDACRHIFRQCSRGCF